MTTKEISAYLKLHPITICKYASEGRIPAIRIGHVWRFDKDVIDEWIAGGQNNRESEKTSNSEKDQNQTRKKRTGKQTT